MTETFHFDIDKIANNAISKTDKTTQIITAEANSGTGQLNFFEKLSPEQQTAIRGKAPALVDNFINDQNALLDFGTSAVEGQHNGQPYPGRAEKTGNPTSG